MKNVNQTVRTIVEVGLFAAIGYVLDEIQGVLSVSFTAGGSIGFAMIAVLIIAYRRGMLPAICVGLIMGLLDMTSKAYVLHPAQVLFDYVLPYAMVGLGAGIFALFFNINDKNNKNVILLLLGTLVGGILKFFCHYIAGVIWWGNPEYFACNLNYMNPYLYAFIYNIAYIGPSIIICGALLVILYFKAKVIFKVRTDETQKVDNPKNKKYIAGWIVSIFFIGLGMFLFIFYLIKYINSFYYKSSSQKYYFDGDCMVILLSGFFGVALGIYLLILNIKNKMKFHHLSIGLLFINLFQLLYALSRILMMYIDEDGEINIKYWVWFAFTLVLLSLSIAQEIYYQVKKRQAKEEIISAN